MSEQVANEEEKENDNKRRIDQNDWEEGSSHHSRAGRRRKVLTAVDEGQTSEQRDEDNNNARDIDEKDTIWEEWKRFLDDPENKKCFTQLRYVKRVLRVKKYLSHVLCL